MKESLISVRNKIFNLGYVNIIRPSLFLIDPEIIHNLFIAIGRILGSNFLTKVITKLLFSYSNKSLEQEILNIHFKNPVGLAAGFDKDGYMINLMSDVGFGFEEIGSITGQPCFGNPKPRLWRLKKLKSLVVNYGLKNQGCDKIFDRLKNKKFVIPLWTSIAKTNSKETSETEEGIKDYINSYTKLALIGDISVINISCPNSFGGQPFHDKDKLNKLLKEISKIKTKKPVFLKLSPDLSKKQIDDIILISSRYHLSGFICSNLTKEKNITKEIIKYPGGLSGKLVEDLSNKQIKYIYQKTKGRFIIVGVGGIFSAEDAYKKIKLGASLVQLITGMIYEGPQLIGQINQDLVKLLEKDSYKNISEAVGVDSQ